MVGSAYGEPIGLRAGIRNSQECVALNTHAESLIYKPIQNMRAMM